MTTVYWASAEAKGRAGQELAPLPLPLRAESLTLKCGSKFDTMCQTPHLTIKQLIIKILCLHLCFEEFDTI